MPSMMTRRCNFFTQATKIDPAFAAPYNQLGYVQISKGDYSAAEQALRQYVATRPERPNPYDSYAELLLRMGRFDESIAQYNKALEKDPQFVASLTGIGHNHLFKGDYAKARETYTAFFRPGRHRSRPRERAIMDGSFLRSRGQTVGGLGGARSAAGDRDQGRSDPQRDWDSPRLCLHSCPLAARQTRRVSTWSRRGR